MFSIDEGGRPLDGILRYIGAEYSFKFDVSARQALLERVGGNGVTSLSIGTLQIEVGVDSGVVLYVWGLHPRTRWQRRCVGSPDYRNGTIRVSNPSPLQRGVGLEIVPVNAWPTFYDPVSGWVLVGDPEVESRVLIASGVILGVGDAQLRSVWLQPVFE